MQTIYFKKQPRIVATGTIAGPKECVGVVGKHVDKALLDDTFGESTYEKAECKMLSYAISQAIKNANAQETDVDMLISGDLLNQIIPRLLRQGILIFLFWGYTAHALRSRKRMLWQRY